MSERAGVTAPDDIDDILKLAGKLADTAYTQTLSRFRTGLAPDAKADLSPVTEADRAAEAAMRALIEKHRPEDGIFGEEYGVTKPDADTIWILDPIDGTKAFVTGKPVWGTLIGVVRNGRAIAGLLDAPATNDRWIGGWGRPTRFNDDRVKVRTGRALSEAWLTSTSPDMFQGDAKQKFQSLSEQCQHTTYGSDCQGYGFLTCGWLDLVCECDLAPYDFAALVPIIEGAGGMITDWNGDALTFGSGGNEKRHAVIAAASSDLHAKAVAILSRAAG